MSIDHITRRKVDPNTDSNEWRFLELTLRNIIATNYPGYKSVTVRDVLPYLPDRQTQLLFRYYHHEQDRRNFTRFRLISPQRGDWVLTDIGLQI